MDGSDFFFYRKNRWYYPSFSQDLNKSFDWYESFFNDAKEKDFIGEDSPTYLTSHIARQRIAKYAPRTKIIVILRDPVDRAYSHYCHLVLTGRLSCSFEYAIENRLAPIVEVSLYKKQIENFLMFLPRNNFHFILLEKFSKNSDVIIKEVLEFLGIPIEDFDLSKIENHKNKSLAPKNIKIKLFTNKITRSVFHEKRYSYANFYSSLTGFNPKNYSINKDFVRVINKISNLINPQQNKKFPPIKQETKQLLNSYLYEQNKGLEELIEENIHDFWFKDF